MATIGTTEVGIATVFNVSVLPRDIRRMLKIQIKEMVNSIEDVEFDTSLRKQAEAELLMAEMKRAA